MVKSFSRPNRAPHRLADPQARERAEAGEPTTFSCGDRRSARSLEKGAPSGDPQWTVATANQLGLQHTLRSPGRPKGSRNKNPPEPPHLPQQ